MKIKKFLCGLLTAAMVFTSAGVVNTTSVEAALEDHLDILTTLTGNNEVEITERTSDLKICVEESGVYDIEMNSYSTPTYYLMNEKGRIITDFSLEEDDVDSVYRQIYFKKGKNYYLENAYGSNTDFKCIFKMRKSNYELEDEVRKHASITAIRLDCLEGNHAFNDESINTTIDGVTWDKEHDTLKFNNYKGNYVFEISYWPIIVADSEDVPDYPEFTVEFTGDNTFENMETYEKYQYPAFQFQNIDVKFVGDGTVNAKVAKHVERESELETETPYSFVKSNVEVTIDGPTINIEKACGIDYTFLGSVLNVKSGEINIESYTVAEYILDGPQPGGVAFYGPIFGANNLSLEGGSIYIKTEEYKGGFSLARAGVLFEGDQFLNVSENIIVGVDIDKDLFESDSANSSPYLYLYGCQNAGGEECTVSDKAKVYVGKGVDKAKVKELIEAEAKASENEAKDNENKVNPNVTKDVKSVNTKVDNNGPKVGTKLSDKKFTYKVTKVGTKDGKTVGEVTVTGLKNKKAKKATVKSIVKINGVKYKVTGISKKAFAKCKKLKKITIKAKTLKKIAKGAFKGVKKNCVIKVPKAKKKAYKKLLKKAGFKGKVK